MRNEDEQFDTLPPAIIQALRDLDGPAVLPDAQRDADVLSGARRHLATSGLSRKRRNLRLFFAGSAGGAIAAAAMVALVVWLGNPFAATQPSHHLAESTPVTPQATATQPGDLDANDSVDILDAYALAKQIDRGQPSSTLDLDGDGDINQRDIDWIATRAVALNDAERG